MKIITILLSLLFTFNYAFAQQGNSSHKKVVTQYPVTKAKGKIHPHRNSVFEIVITRPKYIKESEPIKEKPKANGEIKKPKKT